MAGKTVETKIRFRVEGTGQAAVGIGAVNKEVERVRKEVEQFSARGGLNSITAGRQNIALAQADFRRLALAIGDTELEIQALNKAIAETSDTAALDKLNRRMIQLQATSAELNVELSNIPKELRDSAQQSLSYIGDINSALSGLAGTAASIGGNVTGALSGIGVNVSAGPGAKIAGGLQTGANIAGAAEDTVRLSQALGTMRERLNSINAASIAANQGLLLNVGALAAVAAAAYGVAKAYDYATQKATEPVDAFVDSLDKIDATKLDAASIQTRRQLDAFRQQQTDYASTLEQNISNTKFILENSRNALEEQKGLVGAGIDVLQTVGAAPVTKPIHELEDTLADLEGKLTTVRSNLSLLNSGLAEISIAAAEAAQATQNEYSLALQLLRLRRTGTTEDLANELQTAQIEQEATLKTITDLQNEYTQALRDQVATFSSGSGVDAYLDALSPDKLIGELERMISTAGQTITPGTQLLLDTLTQWQTKATDLGTTITALSDNTLAREIEAREREAAVIEAQKKLLDEITSAQDAYQKSLGDIRDAEADVRKQREDEARDTQTRVLESQIAAAKAREAVSAQQQAINSIRANGQKAERDVINKTIAAEKTARDKYMNSVTQVNAEFMASQLKDWQSYRVEEQRQLEDSQRERLSIIQDTEDSLLDAARANNVSQFLNAQRQGEKKLRDLDETSSIEAKRRSEDFQAERAAATTERNQRLADLKTQYDQEKAQRQTETKQQLADLQAQTEAKLQQQQAAGSQELSESERLQQQLSDLRSQWANEEKIRQRNEARRAAEQHLADARAANQASLNQLRLYNQQRAQLEIAGTNQILNAVTRLLNGSRAGTNTTTTSPGRTNGSTVGLSIAPIPVGTPVQNQSARGGSSGGGGNNTTVHVNMQVGEIVTPSQIDMVVDKLSAAIEAGLGG